METLSAAKITNPSSAPPCLPLTLPSPCNSLPENPVHPAHTYLISSVVTPEDQSPNAFPQHPQQPIFPSPSLSPTTNLQSSFSSTPLVPPTLFDFVTAHPHISQLAKAVDVVRHDVTRWWFIPSFRL
jgi:hypothetical protein